MPRGRSSSVDVGQCRYWRFARTDGTSSFPAALPVRYESVPNLINSIIDDFAPADFVFFVIRSAVLNRRRTVAERVCIHRGMAAHRTFSALLEYYGISVSRKTVLTAGELKFTRNILNVKNRKLSVRNRRNFFKKKKKKFVTCANIIWKRGFSTFTTTTIEPRVPCVQTGHLEIL